MQYSLALNILQLKLSDLMICTTRTRTNYYITSIVETAEAALLEFLEDLFIKQ